MHMTTNEASRWTRRIVLTLATGAVVAPHNGLSAQAAKTNGSLGSDSARAAVTKTQNSPPDAWGQPKNFGLAVGEALLSDFVPWVVNELLPSRSALKISQISPRSWWHNTEEGYFWDDNSFMINHFAHPYQGSMYYNSARSNAFGYWTGLAFATLGSFHWECCGETHLMSVNDWINTAIGGAALGEVLHRTSSMVLDNQATGAGRFWRELGAFALNPTRGFTRLLTGNAKRVYANPEHPSDRIPNKLESVLSLGVRVPYTTREGRGGTLTEDYPTHLYANLRLISGSLAELDRGTPFDYFRLLGQFNFVTGRPLGEIEIDGNWWHRDLSRKESTVSKLVLMQEFQYENTGAYEQGGPSLGLMYYHHRDLSQRDEIAWNAAGKVVLLGGVKSELSFLADVEGVRERFREYDFGIGPGLGLGFEWLRKGRRVIDGSYDVSYLTTLNGSEVEGQGSTHFLQSLRTRATLPLTRSGFGVGIDYQLQIRRSEFDIAEIGLVHQHTHHWQFFVNWNLVRREAR
jgi:Domain of unknown function (DUF3943)